MESNKFFFFRSSFGWYFVTLKNKNPILHYVVSYGMEKSICNNVVKRKKSFFVSLQSLWHES